MPDFDAIVVGAGPNGLAAAIELARAGKRVQVCEAKPTIGGGARTMELTLPGFLHDVCSAIHPLGVGSPFFRSLPLHQFGLEWLYTEIEMAHPFDDGSAALMLRSIEATGETLDPGDGRRYTALMRPFAERWDALAHEILGPFGIPSNPFLLGGFGIPALMPARVLAQTWFRGPKAQAFFAGMAAHSFLPLETVASASFGLVLGILSHAVGWAIPKGGSQSIVNAMTAYLESLGGEIVVGRPVTALNELPDSQAVLFDLTPKQILAIAGDALPVGYRQKLEGYRYGPGVFKMDWALSEPIPWKNADCRRAGTVHLGATLHEIADSERAIWSGKKDSTPYTLVAQQSIVDSTRAPAGKHTGWAYCHVPSGSTEDMSERIIRQIERFAPGFRDTILHTHTTNTKQLEAYNNNYIGGDVNGGVQDIFQLFTRPVARVSPYTTPNPRLYICSSSTPPGGGVHGMCGYHAAKAALHHAF
jgi:phytoene dehydrogenase-like protein